MGPKECYAFFEGHLLPASIDRIIVLKSQSQDVNFCKAFFKVIMRLANDRMRKSKGAAPLLNDEELEEVAGVISGENEDPNSVEAVKVAGITYDIIVDIIEANPEKAGNYLLHILKVLNLMIQFYKYVFLYY